MEMPRYFSDTGAVATPDKWWEAFGSRPLNAFVDSALVFNFNLRTAWQRLQAARAVVDRESSLFLPSLEGNLRGELSRTDEEFVDRDRLSLGLSSAYEVDLWGRIRSQVEAEEYRALASYTDYQAAAVSISAEIVRSWYQLAEARSQLGLIEEQIETNEKMLSLLRTRFGSGQIRGVDILRQRQLLEATREQKVYIESDIEVLQHRLAILGGNNPVDSLGISAEALPTLPAMPSTGIPVELVERRPDVRTAFNLLMAADRELASAISSKYPRLTLSASISTSADGVGNLFENWAMAVAGDLLAPIFYGGQLRAEVDRSEAVKQQRLYEYGQSVLIAFREVEDALSQEVRQKEAIEKILDQLDLAVQSSERLRSEYFNGLADYLEVLTALEEEQRLQRALLSARLLLLEYRIGLYRSLAGGFELAAPEN